MKKQLLPTVIASSVIFATSASALSITYDMTNDGIGQIIEDSATQTTGTQVDDIFTTTLSLPSPGGTANGDGFGPATGDDNEFDSGEIAAFSITLDSISTGASAATFTLTGLDFQGVGEDSESSGTGFEYFSISSSNFTTFYVADESVTESMITAEGLNFSDFMLLSSGDSIDGLTLDLGTVNIGESTDLSFEFFLSSTSTGEKGSLSSITLDVSAVPEPSTYAALAGLVALSTTVLQRRRKA
jgi:hypothetical protein